MVIPTQQPLIWQDIKAILTAPEAHGISASDGMVRTYDILEVLVGTGRWTWIAFQDIEEVIYIAAPEQERLGDVGYFAASVNWPGTALALPQQLFAPALEQPQQPVRWYADAQNAYRAAAALTDDFADAWIWTTRPQLNTGDWSACAWSVFAFLGKSPLKVSKDLQLNQTEIFNLQLRYWYDEIRNLDDDLAIGSATAKLYKSLPREKVEEVLLALLNDSNPHIRINALTALGYLAYKAPMVPGAELPDRATRLEDLSLSDASITRVAKLLAEEPEDVVLDHAICTLRAQSFEGRLKSHGLRIRRILRERLPQITSETTRNDIGKLLRSIPLYD